MQCCTTDRLAFLGLSFCCFLLADRGRNTMFAKSRRLVFQDPGAILGSPGPLLGFVRALEVFASPMSFNLKPLQPMCQIQLSPITIFTAARSPPYLPSLFKQRVNPIR